MAARMKVDRAELERLWLAGEPLAEIARRLHCNAATVWRVSRALGLPARNARLDAGQLAAIRDRLADGWSHAEIARTLKVDPDTIRRHFPGTAWSMAERSAHVAAVRYYGKEIARQAYA